MRKNYFFVKMLLFLFVLFAWLGVTNKAIYAENVPANELSLANSPLNSVAS